MILRISIATLVFACSFLTGANAQAPYYVWARQMGGTSYEYGSAIATDGQGYVYTTGRFQGTVDFDPGPGIANLTAYGSDDIFVQKMDVNGSLVWVKQMGGLMPDYSEAITVDGNGDIYLTGAFDGTADFDPGPGITNLLSNGSQDIFVLKMNANGNLIWVKQMGSTNSDSGFSIDTDSSGNVYATGYFWGIVDFDPGAGTFNMSSVGATDAFVLKLDASGNHIWAKRMGGSSYDYGTPFKPIPATKSISPVNFRQQWILIPAPVWSI